MGLSKPVGSFLAAFNLGNVRRIEVLGWSYTAESGRAVAEARLKVWDLDGGWREERVGLGGGYDRDSLEGSVGAVNRVLDGKYGVWERPEEA